MLKQTMLDYPTVRVQDQADLKIEAIPASAPRLRKTPAAPTENPPIIIQQARFDCTPSCRNITCETDEGDLLR